MLDNQQKSIPIKCLQLVCLLVVLLAAMLLSGCTSDGITAPDQAAESASGESTAAQEPADLSADIPADTLEEIDPLAIPAGTRADPGSDPDRYFLAVPIPDDVFLQMEGKSFPEDGQITKEDLRYLRVLYTDYEGKTCIGELVVNQAAAEDTLAVFRELYEARYPICKMVLVDRYYDTDAPGYEHLDRGNRADCMSIEDNNTSAFNYRLASDGSGILSNHALGLAIDLNPYENPYVNADGTLDGPEGSAAYLDRSDASVQNHMLYDGDPAVSAFRAHGFAWGGSWSRVKDYQHFDYVTAGS